RCSNRELGCCDCSQPLLARSRHIEASVCLSAFGAKRTSRGAGPRRPRSRMTQSGHRPDRNPAVHWSCAGPLVVLFLGKALMGGSLMAALSVNGKTHDVNVDPATDLLWVLRDHLGLTGTKYGCGIKRCGACTVHVDDAAVRSCSVPLSGVAGKQITTIEGLAQNGVLHKVQKAWLEHDVPQCGYCQCGMIMAVAALLNEKPKPTDADID